MTIMDDVLESVGQRLKDTDNIGRINKFVVDEEPKLFTWCTEWASKQLSGITAKVGGLPPDFINHLRNLLVSNVIIGHMITNAAHSKLFTGKMDIDIKDVLWNGNSAAMIDAWRSGGLDDKYYDKAHMEEKGLDVDALGQGWIDAVSAHDSREVKTRKVVADNILNDILSTATPPDDHGVQGKITI